MSNSIAGSGGNSTSSVKSFFKDVGKTIDKFGGRLIEPIKSDCKTMWKFACYIKEKLLSNRESKSEPMVYFEGSEYIRFRNKENGDILKQSNKKVSNSKNTLIFNKVGLSFKEKIKNLFRNDRLRRITKFLLFAVGTALFIAGMFFPPISAIAALTILGIAVTRFIFKAVHIIKQAKVESKLTENKLIFGIKTAFKLLVAAAEIPAFFFVGPLASLITQPISGAILGIMKAYDDIKIDERVKKELNQIDSYEISGEEDVDDEEDSEIDEDVRNSTNSDTSFKENSASDMNIKNNMDINYA